MKNLIIAAVLVISSFAVSAQKSIAYKSPDQQLNEAYCSGLFKTTDGTILDLVSNPIAGSYLNILDWLQGRVAGLQVFITRNGTKIPFLRNQQASIFVDEMQVSPARLEFLLSGDIAMIKVIKTPFFGGFNGSGGAIAIYTVKEDDEEEDESK
ncbi:MAG TPA: hypothetical protein VLJ68_00220 [Chitinophagaceae bacterium]|nr:hypothetical protein [Chitinophagaceae bacterium]